MSRFIVDLSDPAARDAARFGPKAANQAVLGQAGVAIPGGFCLDAAAYRHQLAATGIEERLAALAGRDRLDARGAIADVRIALYENDIVPEIAEPLLAAREALLARCGGRLAVRSSSLMEDRAGASFAGQFQSYLGLEGEDEFLTAVKACWAALWSSRVLRYMEGRGKRLEDCAMAVLVQPLVEARCSGGGMSRTPDGGMMVTAAPGLGVAIAQGEVVPDRYDLTAGGELANATAGVVDHSGHCHVHRQGAPRPGSRAPCLTPAEVSAIAAMMRRAEEVLGHPVEIEWAADAAGIRLVQARPLATGPVEVPDAIWQRHPGLRGHPSGAGWGAGRACVINCECELARVAPGDVLVTRVAGPALAQILPRVSAVVAELGGSTSHLAALARERGIPMVLGLVGATTRIPDGAQVGVDGVAGIVRWLN